MKALAFAISALVFNAVRVAPAVAEHHYDRCDNKVEIEKGEGAGPLFGLEYVMGAHFVAEHYCHASIPPLKTLMEKHLVASGCGPNTEIYELIMEDVQKLRSATLAEFLLEGKADPSFTEADARAALGSIAEENGGCAALAASFHED